jgi:hypothetical protein
MRSPIYSTALAAAGTAKWGTEGSFVLPLDYIQLAFGVAAGGILSEDNNAITYSYYLVFDDCGPDSIQDCFVAQSTTTITITDAKLATRGGVVAADVVRLISADTTIAGWYVVASTPSATTYTLTSATSQTVAAGTPCQHQYFRLFAAPAAITGATTRIAAPLSHSTTGPCTGLVMKCSARTGGSVTGVVVQGGGPG